MIIFSFVLCSARVPLMKPKWGVIGFWRAAKRTAEAAGVGRSSRPPPPPGKVENSCADPWGKSREGGSALGNYASTWGRKRLCRPRGMRAPHRRGRVCGRECVCVSMEVRYMSHGESAVAILPSACNKQTNNNMEPSGLHFQDKRPTLARKVCSLWIMRFPPKNTSTPKQTNTYTCCTPHKKLMEFQRCVADIISLSYFYTFISYIYFTLYCIFLYSTNYTYFGNTICNI